MKNTKVNKRLYIKKKTNKINNKYIKNKSNNNYKNYKSIKNSYYNGFKGGDIKFCKDIQNDKFNFINMNSKTLKTFHEQATRLFPFEECKIQDNKTLNKFCNKNDINNATNLTKLANTFFIKAKKSRKTTNALYSFFKQQLRLIFRKNKYSSSITTWDEFKESPDKSCEYNKFRKLVVNYLIIMIIIYLFKANNIDNYTISKGTVFIFDSNENTNTKKIEIIYEIVGSEDITSDYDVSIYSIPPHPLIPKINSIFNNAFINALDNYTANDIFDTNLYCHPFYIFTNKLTNK